jgi:hypothetical protein
MVLRAAIRAAHLALAMMDRSSMALPLTASQNFSVRCGTLQTDVPERKWCFMRPVSLKMVNFSLSGIDLEVTPSGIVDQMICQRFESQSFSGWELFNTAVYGPNLSFLGTPVFGTGLVEMRERLREFKSLAPRTVRLGDLTLRLV